MNKSISERFTAEEIATYQGWAGREFSEMTDRLYQPHNTDLKRLHPDVVKAIDSWNPEAEKPGLGIIGPTGIGKTRAAYVALQRYVLNYPTPRPSRRPGEESWSPLNMPDVRYLNECEFAEAVLDSFNFDDKEQQAYAKLVLSDLRSCDVLLMDDLGQAKYTDRIQTELYRLVEYRTSRCMPFLWTSNLDAKGLLKKFPDAMRGKAILRRLKEFCTVVTVPD